MMTHFSHLHLNQHQLNHFLETSEILVYNHDEFLIYKNHIPKAAFCLIEGHLTAYKYNKQSIELPKYCLIGFNECLGNQLFKFDLVVKAKSKILVVPKSNLKFPEINQFLA